MKLYALPPSPNTIKVIALANHLGLQLDIVPMDIAKGENKTPEYLAKNPNGLTPTLEDGDFHLWESNAIMEYLAHKAGSPMHPSDPKAHADMMRWMFWGSAHWGAALRVFLFERLVKPMFRQQPPDEAAIQAGMENFHQFAKVLDAHLAKRQFVLGDVMTIADFALAAPLVYIQPAQMPMDGYQNIMAWYGRISALPAWQKAMPQMVAR